MPRPGSASPTLLSVAAGFSASWMVRRQVLVHQRFEVVRRDAADDDHLDRVGQEVDGVVARQRNFGYFDRIGLFAGSSKVRLERHDARLLHRPGTAGRASPADRL